MDGTCTSFKCKNSGHLGRWKQEAPWLLCEGRHRRCPGRVSPHPCSTVSDR